MAVMRAVANSKSLFLNPDLNPFLRAIIKPLIYDQFCAGTSRTEIQRTIARIQNLGFAGVILCYGKEIIPSPTPAGGRALEKCETGVQKWLDGNLETLSMISAGNWLGIKFTGAGEEVTGALLRGETSPPAFWKAMNAIAEKARSQGCRIWIDAEEQTIQPAIDRWTIDLMRKYNRGGEALIYNTIQAYLKESRRKLKHQLELASREGWNLCVKLVRGAYIATEIRDRIHDTKADTDASYNGIVKDLLSGHFEGFTPDTFPPTKLFLAGHNSHSVRTALKLARDLAERDELVVCPEFGQLQGMADEIGCEIVQLGDSLRAGRTVKAVPTGTVPSPRDYFEPRVYKCLTWGTVQECMQYLVRRAVENSAAVDRMSESSTQAKKELMRRLRWPVHGRVSAAQS